MEKREPEKFRVGPKFVRRVPEDVSVEEIMNNMYLLLIK